MDNGECAVKDYMILILIYKTTFFFKFINCYYTYYHHNHF
jgi:hypothetical protein